MEDRLVPSAALDEWYVSQVSVLQQAAEGSVANAQQQQERTVRVVTDIYQSQVDTAVQQTQAIEGAKNQVIQQTTDQANAIAAVVAAQRSTLLKALEDAQKARGQSTEAVTTELNKTLADPATTPAQAQYAFSVTQQQIQNMSAVYDQQIQQIQQQQATLEQVGGEAFKGLVDAAMTQYAQLQAAQQQISEALAQANNALFTQAQQAFKAIADNLQQELNQVQQIHGEILAMYGILTQAEIDAQMAQAQAEADYQRALAEQAAAAAAAQQQPSGGGGGGYYSSDPGVACILNGGSGYDYSTGICYQ